MEHFLKLNKNTHKIIQSGKATSWQAACYEQWDEQTTSQPEERLKQKICKRQMWTRDRSKKFRTDTIKHFALDFVQAIKIRIKHSPKSNSMSIEHWAKQSKSSRASNALASLQAVSFYVPLVLLMLLLLLFSSIHCEWIQPTWKTNDRKKRILLHNHSPFGERRMCWCVFISKHFCSRIWSPIVIYSMHAHRKKPSCVSSLLYTKPESKESSEFFVCK